MSCTRQALALALPAKRFAAVHVLRVLKVMLRRVLKAPLARIGPTGFWTRCWADAASAPYAWHLMLQISTRNGSKVDSPRVCGERGAVWEITLWNRMYSGGEGLTSCGIGRKTFLMSEGRGRSTFDLRSTGDESGALGVNGPDTSGFFVEPLRGDAQAA